MTHLTDDQFTALGGAGNPGPDSARVPDSVRAHLHVCARCRTEAESWTALAEAVRTADRLDFPPTPVPDFDFLLGALLDDAPAPAVTSAGASGAAAGAPSAAASAGAPSAASAASVFPVPHRPRLRRLAPALVRQQFRLLPRSLGPVVFALFVTGGALALLTGDDAWGAMVFGACLNMGALLAALGVASTGRNPRSELFHTLYVPPQTVFMARLVLVLAMTVGAALATSAVTAGVGGPPFTALLAAWFGPSLLGASVALLVALWKAPWLGWIAGFALWAVGALGARSRASDGLGREDVGIGHVMSLVWSTNVWTVTAALVFFAAAAVLVSRPESRPGKTFPVE
ncbi:hypothetical protein [Streptomyces sp. NPDC048442]|uniref:hypothetical protein n=1 Tax=Streptomyces sp. NPDC048442 TaxID=3154823 RepID=UPI003440FC60